MKAIIPAAGLGTRMAKVTGGRPKELLPLSGSPILEWVLREVGETNAAEIIVVGSERKPEIDAFVRERSLSRVTMAHQKEMRGLAHALYCAGTFDDDVLVLLGDTVFSPRSPIQRLARSLAHGSSAVAVETVDEESVSRFGIVEPLLDGGSRIGRILEKPLPSETSSRLAVAGRYALTRDVLRLVRDRFERADAQSSVGETTLTDVLVEALRLGLPIQYIPLETDEVRLDCGSASGYSRAQEVFVCPGS